MRRFTVREALLLLCYFTVCQQPVAGVVTNEFFPFGLENGDSKLERGDDEAVEVLFRENFEFYGQSYSSFHVSKLIVNKPHA